MEDYISQHDDSNPFIVRRRAQVLQDARNASAPYLAKIDQEVRATLSTKPPRARKAQRLKVVK